MPGQPITRAQKKTAARKAAARKAAGQSERTYTVIPPRKIPGFKKKFLATYRLRANIGEACTEVGLHRGMIARWRKADEEFAEDFLEAQSHAVDQLEREAWRRGVEGFDHPVVYQGEITDTYKDYSDVLLTRLLEANRPDKYGKMIKVGGPDGGPLQIQSIERIIIDP